MDQAINSFITYLEGDRHAPLAIHMNGSALQHKRVVHLLYTGVLQNSGSYSIVPIPCHILLTPGVEYPVYAAYSPAAAVPFAPADHELRQYDAALIMSGLRPNLSDDSSENCGRAR